MKILKQLALSWMLVVTVGSLLLALVPNENPSVGALVVDALFLLLGMVCLCVWYKEPSRSNKPIFANFAAFFLVSVAFVFVSRFIGYAVFSGDSWKKFFFFQYYELTHYFLLSFAIVYVVIDSLFNDFKSSRKYLITMLIVGGVFAFYNHQFFQNPKYLYTTEDITDYKAVAGSIKQLASQGNEKPSVEQIAGSANLGVWRNGQQVGILFEDQKARRVAELLPYLQGEESFLPLLFKPLYLDNIYMSVLCVIFVFLFFGYQYNNDPPQGAYIEKIIFLFVPYCSLEILHNYAYIKSVEYATLIQVHQIGWYLTVTNLILLLLFFSLRLRFITSVKGEFYERELVSDAEHISRWRDAFDNLVVRHFLNPKAIHGRLLAPRSPRGEA